MSARDAEHPAVRVIGEERNCFVGFSARQSRRSPPVVSPTRGAEYRRPLPISSGWSGLACRATEQGLFERGRRGDTRVGGLPEVGVESFQCAACSDTLGRAVAAEPRGDHSKLKASELPY